MSSGDLFSTENISVGEKQKKRSLRPSMTCVPLKIWVKSKKSLRVLR